MVALTLGRKACSTVTLTLQTFRAFTIVVNVSFTLAVTYALFACVAVMAFALGAVGHVSVALGALALLAMLALMTFTEY